METLQPASAAPANDILREPSNVLDVPAQETSPVHSNPPSSAHVDMDTIRQQRIANHPTTSSDAQTSMGPDTMPAVGPLNPTTTTDRIESSQESRQTVAQPLSSALNYNPQQREPLAAGQTYKSAQPSSPPLTREKTAPAIGPATDKPTPVPKESEIEGPLLYITLLLSSTGARHPYKLDEKYLKKRNVVVESNNPINLSLYKLKELILRDWREEWEAKPSSPESIRLISMGKMLNDKTRLADAGFKNGATPHIIHMTIKPQEIVDEEDAKMKSAGRDRDGNERSPGCRCIIQ